MLPRRYGSGIQTYYLPDSPSTSYLPDSPSEFSYLPHSSHGLQHAPSLSTPHSSSSLYVGSAGASQPMAFNTEPVRTHGNLQSGYQSNTGRTGIQAPFQPDSPSEFSFLPHSSHGHQPAPLRSTPRSSRQQQQYVGSAGVSQSMAFDTKPVRTQVNLLSASSGYQSGTAYTGAWTRADGEVRIVMVGKTGSGKSATGNTILGRECFESVMSPTSMTEECSKSRGMVGGQKVVVIDTPGLFDTRWDPEKTCKDIGQCITLSAPGPHAFLIVIRLDRFTGEVQQAVQTIQEIFGAAADTYSMVLFTGGDDLRRITIEEFISRSPDLQEVIFRCHGRYHVFNNKLTGGPQVSELLQKIRKMVNENGGSHYTNEMFQEAERAIHAKQQSILRDKEEEIQQEKEKLAAQVRAEYDEKFRNLSEEIKAERMEEKKERKREQKEMASMVNEMQRQGEKFIAEKVQMEMERQKERQNMELMRVRENEVVGQMQSMLVAYNQQVAESWMSRMQISEERQQVALERQKMEMEREWYRKEEEKRQQEREQERVREMERVKWENEQRALIKAQCEKEIRDRQKALENTYISNARTTAENDSSVWGKVVGGVKSGIQKAFSFVKGFFS